MDIYSFKAASYETLLTFKIYLTNIEMAKTFLRSSPFLLLFSQLIISDCFELLPKILSSSCRLELLRYFAVSKAGL